jgi:hypothetical protein
MLRELNDIDLLFATTEQKPQIALGLFHCLISERLLSKRAENMGFESDSDWEIRSLEASSVRHR